MKPKDVGLCQHCMVYLREPALYPNSIAWYVCKSSKHPDADPDNVALFDQPCTLADYEDCEWKEE